MEHLPAPKGGVPIRVPYVGIEEYDGREFMSYPKRMKWTDSHLQGDRNFGNRSRQKAEAFFQTWLYFGCLISVFGHVGIKVVTKDFIRQTSNGDKYVTTRLLPKFIQKWKDKDWRSEEVRDAPHRSRQERDQEKILQRRAASIKEILDEVVTYAKRYCGEINVDPQTSRSPISPLVSMSIIALGTTLYHTATEIYQAPLFRRYLEPHWPPSAALKERLLRAHWCPRDISQFREDGNIDCDYYFSSMQSPRKDQNHEKCTEGVCLGGNMDITTYQTKHATDRCPPECQQPSVEINEIIAIINENGIPLVRWREDDAKINILKFEPDSDMKYVCISHV